MSIWSIAATVLALHLHVAQDDAGPVASDDWIAGELAFANTAFAPLDVQYEIAATDDLPASSLRIVDRGARNQLASLATDDARGEIDVFVVRDLLDLDGPGAISGVTWLAPGHARKYVIVSAGAWQRTLGHELGHVLGLQHSTNPKSLMIATGGVPIDQQAFTADEVAAMRHALARLLATHVLRTVVRTADDTHSR